jgi:hypothetical protein
VDDRSLRRTLAALAKESDKANEDARRYHEEIGIGVQLQE